MIKKNDFIEVSYTGKTKEENFVFDTTEETVAKEAGIYNPEGKYGTLIICVGQHHLLPGLDKFIEGKDLGNFTVELPPEEAFGKKNAKLIQLIPTSKFIQQRIQPQVGLQVTIDGHLGVIKTVTGGRTLVDFNHPLSGKNVLYEISIKKKITDQKEQALSLLKMRLGLTEVTLDITEHTLVIRSKHNIPEPIQEQMSKEIKELTPFQEVTWGSKA
ncbi:peptidylprolyl isomerase [Candidatus Woesearchaeota archaeon]|nr:peptidylprolyl isomerase [Candidatus Woesearchaeota archaeon]